MTWAEVNKIAKPANLVGKILYRSHRKYFKEIMHSCCDFDVKIQTSLAFSRNFLSNFVLLYFPHFESFCCHYTLYIGQLISEAATILQGLCIYTLDINHVIFKAAAIFQKFFHSTIDIGSAIFKVLNLSQLCYQI